MYIVHEKCFCTLGFWLKINFLDFHILHLGEQQKTAHPNEQLQILNMNMNMLFPILKNSP